MYQLRINVNNEYSYWFYAVESRLRKNLKDLAVFVTSVGDRRTYFAFACENAHKHTVCGIIKSALVEMLSQQAKYEYLKDKLPLPMLTSGERSLLLSALVEFDRECEKQLITRAFTLTDGLSIDGVFNFRMRELKSRWDEIGDLTSENSFYLADKEIFYELVKFLFSAIKPKIKGLSIDMDGDQYVLRAHENGQRLRVVYDDEQLMCSLIEYAPLEIYFEDEIVQNGTMKKLSKLFSIKQKNADNIYY